MKNKTKLKPNNYFYFLLTLIALLSMPQLMAKHAENPYYSQGNVVDIDIVNDYGRQFTQYPVYSKQYTIERAYLEAKNGKAYGIKVRNNSGERIGLVIAVDGRNIISGKRSNLKSKERMYILNPYENSTYKGWRSSRNRVNEFYFTDVSDSYADRAFADRSAMGVIAVAVFKEKNGHWHQENRQHYDSYSKGGRSKGGRPKPESNAGALKTPQSKGSHNGNYEANAEPGTGYGEDHYSPTRRVEFKAQRKAAKKHFIKYEWKATLCEMGITSCRRPYKPKNRFWDNQRNSQYVPPPPTERYRYYANGRY